VSPVVWRWRWMHYSLRLGSESPRVRALFGRYVASMGGTLTESAGLPALTASMRPSHPGWSNRSYRRSRNLPTGGTLFP
jgi:hypothetical protein